MSENKESGETPAKRPAKRPGKDKDITSPWEWVAGVVGLLIVVAVLWLLVDDALASASPPDIAVEVDSIVATRGAGHRVHFTATNSGKSGAGDIVVEGELVPPAGETIRSSATISYVPGESEVSGGLFFRADPRNGTLTVRALGYVEP